MLQRKPDFPFNAKKVMGRAAPLAAALLLSSCMSTDVLDLTPQPGTAVTGQYPSMGQPPEAATTQMSDAEAAAMGTELDALAAQEGPEAESEAEYQKRVAAMRKLAQSTHDAANSEN